MQNVASLEYVERVHLETISEGHGITGLWGGTTVEARFPQRSLQRGMNREFLLLELSTRPTGIKSEPKYVKYTLFPNEVKLSVRTEIWPQI